MQRSILRPAGAALLLLAVASAVHAQTPAATAAPAAAAPSNVPNYGPPLPGVCVFSRDVALGTSAAGVSVNQQLQQMEQAAQGSLNTERLAIQQADKALSADKAKLTPAKYQERVGALQQRAQAYEAGVQARSNQFSQARDNATGQIAQAITPILVTTISEHHCSLVIERNSLLGANPAMELTPEVIQKLNAALPGVTVTLPTAPAAR